MVLSKEEKTAIEVLETQPWTMEFYEAFAKTWPQISVEAVVVKGVKAYSVEPVEVLLIPRPADDVAFPGQLHCPGVIKRNRETLTEALERLNKKEIGAPFTKTRAVGYISLPEEARGDFLCLVFLCVINGEPTRGEFYPMSDLPLNTVASHRNHIIPVARKQAVEFLWPRGFYD